jgi:hypothetical protein
MVARSRAEIESIWLHVNSVKKLFDRIVGLGPFGVGLDAILAWVPIPGVAALASAGVGVWMLSQAFRARASAATIMRMVGYLGFDTATDVVPIPGVGSLIDTVFQGQMLAGTALQKDIESTHWVEGTSRQARDANLHESHVAEMKRLGLRRIVYLHD